MTRKYGLALVYRGQSAIIIEDVTTRDLDLPDTKDRLAAAVKLAIAEVEAHLDKVAATCDCGGEQRHGYHSSTCAAFGGPNGG